jgi:DNA-binding NtrC family response regulator
VVTATQRPLADLVAEGKFREDLMYRLNVVEVVLPALRERTDDIPALCEHFLRLFAEQRGLPRRHLTRAALGRLMLERWPGNVRQLEHVLLQASVMATGSTLDVDALGLDARVSALSPEGAEASSGPRVASLGDHKLDEKQRILDALQACGWNRAKAAQALGMPRRTFYRRLSDYAILT